MILTTPLRRTTLQLSQRGLTDARTFIKLPNPLSFMPISDTATGQIVGGQF
jgi:hypothetical protein